MVKYILFDLDGTLIDTIDDLGLACDFLLRQAGKTPGWSRAEYMSFVGNGAKQLVNRAFGGELSGEELGRQYLLFKQKYNEIKLQHAYAYSGVCDVLTRLKAAGFSLAVCTNKPGAAAQEMVEAVFGKDMFDFVSGASDSGPIKPDVFMLKAILKQKGISPQECIWVGDSGVDIASAKNLGCKVIAVTWGFVSRDVLLSLLPDYIADRAEDIWNILMPR